MSRIYPSWDEIDQMRNPLEPGERQLAEYLDQHLPDNWEVYVQPFLNGDRPDIVILNDAVGAMIYEVKDWSLSSYHWENKQLMVSDRHGSYPVLSPVAQVNHYRDNIIGLYLPQIGETVDLSPKAFGVIKTGVYFHRATGNEARDFMPGFRETIVGQDDLRSDNLARVVPDVERKGSHWMTKEWADGLRIWLRPPFHTKEQNSPLVLNRQQLGHAEADPGHKRLRGVAGSGKTAVLAWRAAKLASQGRRVLVVCFNITLWHYIRDLVQRCSVDFDGKLIEYRHFHGVCRAILNRFDQPWPAQTADTEAFFREIIPQAVLDTMREQPDISTLKYDAILIDEGQDFCQEWYDMLTQLLTEQDELFLVVDKLQNIYQRDLSWVDGPMRNVKFRGPWRELKQSMRLPPLMVDQANRFARRFLPHLDEPLVEPSQQYGFADPELWWVNCASLDEAKEQVWAAYQYLTQQRGHQPTDIVILLPSHEVGLETVRRFEQANVQVNHVFEERDEDHPKRHKHTFWMGDARLKMSTIHSFKGWELTNVILIIPYTGKSHDTVLALQVYSALTRMARLPRGAIDRPGCFIVLNHHSDFDTYGAQWPNHWEVRPVTWPITQVASEVVQEPDWLAEAPVYGDEEPPGFWEDHLF